MSAPNFAARATAEVSEPPLPKVVTSRCLFTPWKPVIITMFFFSSSLLILSVEISLILALLYVEV